MDALWLDGRFLTTDARAIAVEDRGFQFGDGVYEVLRLVERAPVLHEPHFARLCRSLALIEIPNPWTFSTFEALISALLERTSLDSGLLYLQVTRGACARSHAWPDELTPTALAYARPFSFPSAEARASGITAVTVPETRSRLCHVKSINLLPNVLAKKAAQRALAGEALFVEGSVVREGASSSVFGVRNGVLITHPDGPEILPGTVRDCVVAFAEKRGIRVDRRPLILGDLEHLDELFITSTSQGVMPLVKLDGASVARGERGPICRMMQDSYDELEREELARWRAQR